LRKVVGKRVAEVAVKVEVASIDFAIRAKPMPAASAVKSVMTLRWVRSLVKRWITTQSALQELRRLDDTSLRDIGLTRGDIYRTAAMQEAGSGDVDAPGRKS
jgi:uncharacterized protein YjiS (DUF1127 family)